MQKYNNLDYPTANCIFTPNQNFRRKYKKLLLFPPSKILLLLNYYVFNKGL